MKEIMTFDETHDLSVRKATLLTMLHGNDCELTFTKVDGSMRTMPCTLRVEALPPITVVEDATKRVRPQNPDVLSVWCLDSSSWKSFRIMNAHEIKVI